jgi:hypothetical protein
MPACLTYRSKNPAGVGTMHDVIADGAVVGRIMLFTANPTELPWVWTIAPGYEEGRSTTHGYAKTLEAATQAFAHAGPAQSGRIRIGHP